MYSWTGYEDTKRPEKASILSFNYKAGRIEIGKETLCGSVSPSARTDG